MVLGAEAGTEGEAGAEAGVEVDEEAGVEEQGTEEQAGEEGDGVDAQALVQEGVAGGDGVVEVTGVPTKIQEEEEEEGDSGVDSID